MALCKTEAIVLRAHNFSESSKIVTLYTLTYGKCKVIAKGARRPKSRLRGHLETASHIMAVFYKKDGRELHTLSQSEIITAFHDMRFNPERFALVNALCELLDRLTPLEAESRAIFSLALDSLKVIETTQKETLNALLWFFELRLLSLLGFRPELHSCVGCRGEVRGQGSGLSLVKGGALCTKCAVMDEEAYRLSPESLALLRHLQRIRAEGISRVNISRKAAAETDNLLQAFLKYHTDDPRDIQSLRILSSIRSRLYPSQV